MKLIRALLLAPLFFLNPIAQADFSEKARAHYEKMLAPHEGIIFGEISENGATYGSAGFLGKDRAPIDEHSLFEIGSISKTFAGVLLADQVLKGNVQLEDPITDFLPSEVAGTESSLSKITFLELATHTSGLPRLPTNLDEGANPADPYAHYSTVELFDYLSGFTEEGFEKRGEFSYSNLGLGLLGVLLERISEKPYEELLSEVILSPLGLKETFFQRNTDSIPASAEKRFATGHTGGREVSHWRIDSLGAAGAIVSSAHDMLRYAESYWSEETPIALREAYALATKKHAEGIGLAWFLNGESLNHDGGTGGFVSSLTIEPNKKTAFIKLENTSSYSLEEEISGDFSSLEGYWSGTLKGPSGDLPQVFRVDSEGVVHLYSPSQTPAGMRSTVSRFADGFLHCEFPTIGGHYEGKLVDQKLKGAWTQGSEYPLDLEFSPTIPDGLKTALSKVTRGDFSDLEGFWSGYLGGKEGLFVVFSITSFTDTADIYLLSPDQGNAVIPATKASFQDDSLFFFSELVNGTLHAELDGKTLRGTWNQGIDLPLELSWSADMPSRE